MARIASHLMPVSLTGKLYSASVAALAALAKAEGVEFKPGPKPEPQNGHVVFGFTFAKPQPAADSPIVAKAPEAPKVRERRPSPGTLNPLQIDGGAIAYAENQGGYIKLCRAAFTADNIAMHGKCSTITPETVKAFGKAVKHARKPQTGLACKNGYTLLGFDASKRKKPFVVMSPATGERGESLWLADAAWVNRNLGN